MSKTSNKPKRVISREELEFRATIAELIKKFRTEAGMTQKQLANLIGTSHTHISSMEKARFSMTVDYLYRLKEVLKFDIVFQVNHKI